MISKIRNINLKNKVHNNGSDRETEPLNLAAIVPADKDDGGLFESKHQINKAIIDSHIRDNDQDEQDEMSESLQMPENQPLKRASTFSRFSTHMKGFFANMRGQHESENSTYSDETTDEPEPLVPVNPMQHLLGAVSNNAYVSWTHLSKVIKAMEVIEETWDMNASDMNKAMLQQCIILLKNSPYVLKSKKDDSLAHKPAKFYKKSEVDENGDMIVNKPIATVSKSRRASITAINQLRQTVTKKVIEFNAIPYGQASNNVSGFVNNMVQLHLDPAFDIYSEKDGQIISYNNPNNTNNNENKNKQSKTEAYEINADELGVDSETEKTSNTAKTTTKSRRGSKKLAKSYVIDVSVSNEITDKISNCLSKINSWNEFNLFELFELAGHMSLPILATHIFKEYNLVSKLGFNESKLLNYFQCIQQVYNSDVPYHNAQHGADVLVTSYQIVKSRRNEIFDSIKLQNYELFSLFMGATIHDTGHKGKNNDWHIRTQSDLALLYNDISVLENYHVAAAWRVITLKENDFFKSGNDGTEDKNKIRKLVTDIVLHTDMSRHGHVVQTLGSIVNDHGIIRDENGDIVCTQNEFTDAERKAILQGIVHTADISNPAKKFDFMYEWTNRINTEFWKQGDEERELGLKVSPLCDRENPIVEKSAIGFGKFVVMPLLQKMQPLFGVMDVAIDESNKNLEYWGKQVAALNKVTE